MANRSGGYVAYEMAQQLVAARQEVALLALFDTYGPGIWWNQTLPRVARRILAHVQVVRQKESGSRLPYFMARVRGVGMRVSRRVWTARHQFYRRLGLPMPDSLRQIGRTNSLAITQYVPRAYPGRLTLFSALEQSIAAFNDPEIGWRGMAAGGVEVHVTPGSHITMLEEPHVRRVAQDLRSILGISESTPGSLPA